MSIFCEILRFIYFSQRASVNLNKS